MNNLIIPLAGISIAFFVFLLLKELFGFSKRFCAICIAVSLNWIALLVLYWLGIFEDIIIIALLLGETSLGIFYLVESKIKAEFKLFRLPFLLSLITAAYYLLTLKDDFLKPLIFLIALWLLFVLIYISKNNKQIGALVEKIIKCCREF